MTTQESPRRTLLDWVLVASSIVFILVLAVSAAFEPKIRVLHTFQAFIYLAVIWLALRHSKWGYAMGIAIASFWNYTNLFVNNFFSSGIENLRLLLAGKPMPNAGTLFALPAVASHFVLIFCCLLAYARLRDKRLNDLGVLVAGAVAVIGYFWGIIALFGPQYLPLFRRAFHLG